MIGGISYWWSICYHHGHYSKHYHSADVTLLQKRCSLLDIFNDLSLLDCIILSRIDASDKIEVVYEEPDLKLYRAKKDQDIELEKCPAYGEKMADQNVELKECPAYGI